MATIGVKEVAALAGVSIGTVSNVLNRPDKVTEATAARVHAAIEQLGFIRNDAARQLRAGSSRAIGLVILDVANPFFTGLARGAQERAAESGLSVILGYSDEKVEREASYLDLFEEQRVHGVLLSPAAEPGPRLERLRAHGIPAVLVDRLSTDTSFSSVSVDDIRGGATAVGHLLAQGRRRIAFIGGPLTIRQVSDRLHGASEAASAEPRASLEVVTVSALTVAEGRRVGRQIARRDPAARPDAVFAANDLVALGVLEAMLIEGTVKIPEQMSLIGYDDIGFAGSAMVPVSSIRQPMALMGQTAVDVLMEEASGAGRAAQHVVFQPELVVRESSQR
ncbi:LacI family DNA-binding transcriptional regulator [Frondihabitans cladoniiphilus]|uniref:LacI family DNA-binding transcriptional regulator n=1 Tax=Frondihabitans cladoniiphilus TaxID=715785 RepID=A0ABP8W7H6_9MICO